MPLLRHLIRILLVLEVATEAQTQLMQCDSENKCLCTIKNIICSQFTSFDQLQFLSSNSAFSSISLYPLTFISLDSRFTLSGLYLANNSRIHLTKLKSLLFDVNPFVNNTSIKMNLKLSESNLDFYSKSEQLSSVCNLRGTIDSQNVPLLSSFSRIELTDSVRFIGTLCPLVFRGARIDELILSNLSDSNTFQFTFLPETIPLNATIKRLVIQSSTITDLSLTLLSCDEIFRNLQELSITYSNLYHISANTFLKFNHLTNLLFYLENFEEFIHHDNSSLNLWMSNLLPNKQLLLGLIDPKKSYQFPNNDFCLFVHIPRPSQVFVYIQTKAKLNCSCTVLWLMQNWTESENSSLIQSSESVAECLSDREKFKEMSDRCDFVSMRADCLGKTENSQKTSSKINTFLLLALLCAAGVIASLVVASVWFVLTKKRHSADESQSKKKVYFWSKPKIEPISNLDKLFQTYQSRLFCKSEYDYGRCLSRFEHSILLSPNSAQLHTLLKTSTVEKPANFNDFHIQEQINELLKRRIITQVDSDLLQKYRPLSVYYYKKRSRFIVDLSSLNKLICLEVCESVLSEEDKNLLVNSKVFSVLDFRGGTYQVGLDEVSKEKTIFRIPQKGIFKFEVIPPGLVNATSTFEKLLRIVLASCLAERFCLIHFGRIIVYSGSFEEHICHLTRLFEVVCKQGLKLKREDCLFMQTKIRLFNNLIGSGQLVHNEETLMLVDSISRPQKSRPSKRFFSLCEIYKEVLTDVGNFSDLMRRLKLNVDLTDSGAFGVLKRGILKTLDRDLGSIQSGRNLLLVVNLKKTCFSCSLFEQQNRRVPIAFARKPLLGSTDVDSEEKVACVEWAVKSYESVLIRRRFSLALFHRKSCVGILEMVSVMSNGAWIEKMSEFRIDFSEVDQELNRVNEILVGLY